MNYIAFRCKLLQILETFFVLKHLLSPFLLTVNSLPLHCVVESVHSLQASLAIDSRSPWKRRTNIETDSYVIMAAATPWSELVQTALQRLGYSQEAVNTARGKCVLISDIGI